MMAAAAAEWPELPRWDLSQSTLLRTPFLTPPRPLLPCPGGGGMPWDAAACALRIEPLGAIAPWRLSALFAAASAGG